MGNSSERGIRFGRECGAGFDVTVDCNHPGKIISNQYLMIVTIDLIEIEWGKMGAKLENPLTNVASQVAFSISLYQ